MEGVSVFIYYEDDPPFPDTANLYSFLFSSAGLPTIKERVSEGKEKIRWNLKREGGTIIVFIGYGQHFSSEKGNPFPRVKIDDDCIDLTKEESTPTTIILLDTLDGGESGTMFRGKSKEPSFCTKLLTRLSDQTEASVGNIHRTVRFLSSYVSTKEERPVVFTIHRNGSTPQRAHHATLFGMAFVDACSSFEIDEIDLIMNTPLTRGRVMFQFASKLNQSIRSAHIADHIDPYGTELYCCPPVLCSELLPLL